MKSSCFTVLTSLIEVFGTVEFLNLGPGADEACAL